MRLFRGSQIRPGIARLARLVTGRPGRAVRDADDQIALHLALRAEQLIAQGLSPEAARAEAERRFGPLDDARHGLHASATRRDRVLGMRERFDDLRRDVRVAIRGLRRTPGFAITVVICLALGVGANAASFSMVEELLLRPLPVSNPDQLVNVTPVGPRTGSDSCNQSGLCNEVFSYPMYRDLERGQTSFNSIAAHRMLFANLSLRDRSAFGMMTVVSGSYFPTLGVRPALGRLLTTNDDRVTGEHPVAVLSHAFWTTRFGADPSVIGSKIQVNGYPLTVVGVAPEGFEGTTLGQPPLLYVPFAMTARVSVEAGPDGSFTNRRRYWLYVFARLRPGVTVERASADLDRIYRPILADVEAPLQERMSDSTLARFKAGHIRLTDGKHGQSTLRETTRRSLLFLFGITGIVLLIACANIANLLLARSAARQTEMAVRLSLGASRRRLLAQLLTEALLLATIGGAASLVVAYGMLELIRGIIPAAGGLSVGATLALDLRPSALLFAGALSLVTVVAFGLIPAFHGTRAELITGIRAASQPTGTRRTERFRTTLVTTQIALSMALLVSAGLFVKSLRNIARIDLGVRVDGMVSFGLAPVLNGYDPTRTQALFVRVEEQLAALPGVTGVAASRVALMTSSSNGANVRVEGFVRGPDTDANTRINKVGPGYFRVLGARLLAGREFTEADRLGAPRVGVVNEAFAKKFNLGQNPIGKRAAVDGDSPPDALDIEIVGLARDAKYSEAKGEMPPMIYLPYRQESRIAVSTFYVRTSGSVAQVLRAVPPTIARLDPNLPVVGLTTMAQQVSSNTYMDRMITTLAAGFAALATLLAAVGLYGVLAYTVTQRRKDFGIRMALGASAGRVRGMVLSHVGRMAIVGGIIGIIGSIAIGRATQTLLFESSATDPLVMALAAVVLGLVTFAAGYVPAWRASRVDPVQVLRGD